MEFIRIPGPRRPFFGLMAPGRLQARKFSHNFGNFRKFLETYENWRVLKKSEEFLGNSSRPSRKMRARGPLRRLRISRCPGENHEKSFGIYDFGVFFDPRKKIRWESAAFCSSPNWKMLIFSLLTFIFSFYAYKNVSFSEMTPPVVRMLFNIIVMTLAHLCYLI